MVSKSEPKGTLVTVPVRIPDHKQLGADGYPIQIEVLSYVMRMGEKMPAFNFWPRGKEIIHRLIMKAASTDSLDNFTIYQTDESVLHSIIYE